MYKVLHESLTAGDLLDSALMLTWLLIVAIGAFLPLILAIRMLCQWYMVLNVTDNIHQGIMVPGPV